MAQPSPTQEGTARRDGGRALRAIVPAESFGDWAAATGRDPVAAVLADDEGRLDSLVPERHRRMALSPFAFFRATAGLMAADLAPAPRTGLEVQACGDAHASNFGTFATPERRQVFDLNDFDETMRGPWEWDLQRLVASLVLAARDNGFGHALADKAVRGAVLGYAEAMARLAEAPAIDVWYDRVDLAELEQTAPRRSGRERVAEVREEARRHTGESAARKLTEKHRDSLRLRHRPPFLVPLRHIDEFVDEQATRRVLTEVHDAYVESLPEERHRLLDEYAILDAALKVVGVGSVGTRCLVVLLAERSTDTPLLLQIKEARRSVLAAHLGDGPYANDGERVVRGQRAIQATTDVFLGWTVAESGRSYYVRQFRDMKGSVDLSTLTPRLLRGYGRVCAQALALAHAVSGDRQQLTGYLGDGADLAPALVRFAERYADQVEADHAAFVAAVPESSSAS